MCFLGNKSGIKKELFSGQHIPNKCEIRKKKSSNCQLTSQFIGLHPMVFHR